MSNTEDNYTCELCGEPEEFSLRCDICHRQICVDCLRCSVDSQDQLTEACVECKPD